jgi:hypothetical protein
LFGHLFDPRVHWPPAATHAAGPDPLSEQAPIRIIINAMVVLTWSSFVNANIRDPFKVLPFSGGAQALTAATRG